MGHEFFSPALRWLLLIMYVVACEASQVDLCQLGPIVLQENNDTDYTLLDCVTNSSITFQGTQRNITVVITNSSIVGIVFESAAVDSLLRLVNVSMIGFGMGVGQIVFRQGVSHSPLRGTIIELINTTIVRQFPLLLPISRPEQQVLAIVGTSLENITIFVQSCDIRILPPPNPNELFTKNVFSGFVYLGGGAASASAISFTMLDSSISSAHAPHYTIAFFSDSSMSRSTIAFVNSSLETAALFSVRALSGSTVSVAECSVLLCSLTNSYIVYVDMAAALSSVTISLLSTVVFNQSSLLYPSGITTAGEMRNVTISAVSSTLRDMEVLIKAEVLTSCIIHLNSSRIANVVDSVRSTTSNGNAYITEGCDLVVQTYATLSTSTTDSFTFNSSNASVKLLISATSVAVGASLLIYRSNITVIPTMSFPLFPSSTSVKTYALMSGRSIISADVMIVLPAGPFGSVVRITAPTRAMAALVSTVTNSSFGLTIAGTGGSVQLVTQDASALCALIAINDLTFSSSALAVSLSLSEVRVAASGLGNVTMVYHRGKHSGSSNVTIIGGSIVEFPALLCASCTRALMILQGAATDSSVLVSSSLVTGSTHALLAYALSNDSSAAVTLTDSSVATVSDAVLHVGQQGANCLVTVRIGSSSLSWIGPRRRKWGVVATEGYNSYARQLSVQLTQSLLPSFDGSWGFVDLDPSAPTPMQTILEVLVEGMVFNCSPATGEWALFTWTGPLITSLLSFSDVTLNSSYPALTSAALGFLRVADMNDTKIVLHSIAIKSLVPHAAVIMGDAAVINVSVSLVQCGTRDSPLNAVAAVVVLQRLRCSNLSVALNDSWVQVTRRGEPLLRLSGNVGDVDIMLSGVTVGGALMNLCNVTSFSLTMLIQASSIAQDDADTPVFDISNATVLLLLSTRSSGVNASNSLVHISNSDVSGAIEWNGVDVNVSSGYLVCMNTSSLRAVLQGAAVVVAGGSQVTAKSVAALSSVSVLSSIEVGGYSRVALTSGCLLDMAGNSTVNRTEIGTSWVTLAASPGGGGGVVCGSQMSVPALPMVVTLNHTSLVVFGEGRLVSISTPTAVAQMLQFTMCAAKLNGTPWLESYCATQGCQVTVQFCRTLTTTVSYTLSTESSRSVSSQQSQSANDFSSSPSSRISLTTRRATPSNSTSSDLTLTRTLVMSASKLTASAFVTESLLVTQTLNISSSQTITLFALYTTRTMSASLGASSQTDPKGTVSVVATGTMYRNSPSYIASISPESTVTISLPPYVAPLSEPSVWGVGVVCLVLGSLGLLSFRNAFGVSFLQTASQLANRRALCDNELASFLEGPVMSDFLSNPFLIHLPFLGDYAAYAGGAVLASLAYFILMHIATTVALLMATKPSAGQIPRHLSNVCFTVHAVFLSLTSTIEPLIAASMVLFSFDSAKKSSSIGASLFALAALVLAVLPTLYCMSGARRLTDMVALTDSPGTSRQRRKKWFQTSVSDLFNTTITWTPKSRQQDHRNYFCNFEGIFMQYRSGWHGFFVVEALLPIVCGLCYGVSAGREVSCQSPLLSWLLLIVCVPLLLFLVIVRPYSSAALNAFVIVNCALFVVECATASRSGGSTTVKAVMLLQALIVTPAVLLSLWYRAHRPMPSSFADIDKVEEEESVRSVVALQPDPHDRDDSTLLEEKHISCTVSNADLGSVASQDNRSGGDNVSPMEAAAECPPENSTSRQLGRDANDEAPHDKATSPLVVGPLPADGEVDLISAPQVLAIPIAPRQVRPRVLMPIPLTVNDRRRINGNLGKLVWCVCNNEQSVGIADESY